MRFSAMEFLRSNCLLKRGLGCGERRSVEDLLRRLHDVLRCKAEVLHHLGARSRGAKAVDTDDGATFADPTLPTKCRPRLDRHSGRSRRPQHLLAIGLVLA